MANSNKLEFKHMVIGHSQLQNMEKYRFENKPEINFQIDFISVADGKAPQLVEMIKEEIRHASQPLRISGIIWQNSICDLSTQTMEDIVLDIEDFLKDYPSHRVALPECQYAPQLEQYWDKIARLNTILDDYNLRQGFNSYSLHKTTMQYSKQKKSLVVRQSSYREFNNALRYQKSSKTPESNQLGFYIDEGAPKTRYAQHIRKFHKYGFNDSIAIVGPSAGSWHPHKRSSTIFFARNPVNKMKDPKTADARLIINKIKSTENHDSHREEAFKASMNNEKNDEPIGIDFEETGRNAEALEETLSEGEEKEDKQTSSSSETCSELIADRQLKAHKWLKYGEKNGMLKALKMTIKKRVKRGLKKKYARRSPSSSSSSTSSSSSEEERRRKRKKKYSRKKRSRDSSTSSSDGEKEKRKKLD